VTLYKTTAATLACSLMILSLAPAWTEEPSPPALITPAALNEYYAPEERTPSKPLAQAPSQVTVSVESVKIESGLMSKKYSGYEITLTNHGPNDLIITDAVVNDGITGEEAYKGSKKRLIGITSFLGVSGLVITTVRRRHRNGKAKLESVRFDGQFHSGPLPVGHSTSALALTPLGIPFESTITFTDVNTGNVYACDNTSCQVESKCSPAAEVPAQEQPEAP
jgi:hypothetical protein